jgi:RNA polymerase sigma factor (sigma-70 family)
LAPQIRHAVRVTALTRRDCNRTGVPNDIPGVSDVNAEPRPSLERIYRDQRLTLIRLALLLTGSRELAEDIVQTAFVSAQARWTTIDDHVAYLRRVVVNQAHDAHRRRYRRRLPDRAEPVTHQPDIDETWAELRRLPPQQRAVVVLRFYEDLPLTEIAQMLHRPPGTVRSDLHRALDRLRRTLP